VSVSSNQAKNTLRIWTRSGGRCEYEGCNEPLWRDDLTMTEMNRAYIAHIVAKSSDGPRGDPELSPKLADDPSNLMLLCDAHHRLVDREEVDQHPVERLRRMKELHEERIEIVTGITAEKRSEVLLYGANIGTQASPVSRQKAVEAMLPDRYPDCPTGITLGMVNSAFRDDDDAFWCVEEENLRRLFQERVSHRLATGTIEHLSVFGAAPQPLLVLLGTLLSDLTAADVFQLHREPAGWRWPDSTSGIEFCVKDPSRQNGQPALVLSLSATITEDRILPVLGDDASLWTLAITTPNNDFLKSRRQLQQFRETVRPLLDRIKAVHGQKTPLHIFPAVPVSVAVELGRVRTPKADQPWIIYDQVNARGGFVRAITIPKEFEYD